MKFLKWFSERRGKVHQLATKLEVATDSGESEDEDRGELRLTTCWIAQGNEKSLSIIAHI